MSATALSNHFSRLLQEAVAHRQGARDPWWQSFQEKGAEEFYRQGLPTHKSEAYRYTPLLVTLAPLFTPQATTTNQKQIEPPCWERIAGIHISLCNGTWVDPLPSLLPEGVCIRRVTREEVIPDKVKEYVGRRALPEDDPFVALNSGLFHTLVWLDLAPGTCLDRPLLLHHEVGGGASNNSHPRLLITLGAGSKAVIVETTQPLNQGPLLLNRVAELVLEPGAALDHYLVQSSQAPGFSQLHYTFFWQKNDTAVRQCTASGAQTLVRNHLTTQLTGQGAQAHLYGLYVAAHSNYLENHLKIHHQAEKTTSATLYKGVAASKGSGVFNGEIIVDHQAKKTVAHQHHHGWLLDDTAHIYARPQLAIKEQAVQCSHGASIRKLSEEVLTYLRSRGIPYPEASQLLLEAFFSDLLGHIPLEDLRKVLYEDFIRAARTEMRVPPTKFYHAP